MPQIVFVGALLVTGVYQYFRITGQSKKARDARMYGDDGEDFIPDKDSMLSKKQKDNLRNIRNNGRSTNRRMDGSDEEGSEEDRRRLTNRARQGTGADPIFSKKTQGKLAQQEEELKALQDQLKGLEGTLGTDLKGVMSQLNDLKQKTRTIDSATSRLERQAKGPSHPSTREDSELMNEYDSDE